MVKRGVRSLGAAAFTSVFGWTALFAQEVVEMPGQDRPLGADFEEVFRIGSIDGDTWETFGEVAGTAFDAAGNLYVFDRQGSRITVVDREGRFVREVGKEGEGPGEFRMPFQFAVMRDGRLVVADIGHRSYQIFDAEGEFERMVSMSMDDGMLRMGGIAPSPDGRGVISGGGNAMVAIRSQGGGAPAGPETRPIEFVSLEGDVVETTRIADGWMPPRGEPQTIEGGGMRLAMGSAGPRTFEPGLLVDVLPDGGVVYSDSSAYVLYVVGPEGDVGRILKRPFEPEPVTERMEDAEKERRLADLEAGEAPTMRLVVSNGGGAGRAIGGDQMREIMENQIAQLQFYHELPVLTQVETSWTGKVWVERRGEEPTGDGPIDVLTADGRYQGTFAAGETEIPSSFGPDGLAAYIELDEFDVPSVIVRKLPPVLN